METYKREDSLSQFIIDNHIIWSKCRSSCSFGLQQLLSNP